MRAKRFIAMAMLMALAAVPAGMVGCEMMPGSAGMEPAAPYSDLPDLQAVGLKQQWQRHVPLAAGERLRNAWRVGNSIYLASNQSRLFRLDKSSGVLAFAKGLSSVDLQIFRPSELRPAPDQNPNEVLVCTRGEAFVLDRDTGDEHRSRSLPRVSVSSTPVVVGNIMCVGGANRFVGMYIDHLGVQAWNVIMGDSDLFLSTPVVQEKNVIVASLSGQLARINTETGDWDWKDRKTNGQVTGGLAADGRAVYVPSLDQRLYAFRAEGGGELWQCPLGGVLDGTPALGGDVVMVAARGRGLYGVGRQAGDERWLVPGVTSVATVNNDRVWAGDEGGNLKAISLANGEVLSSTQIPYVQFFVRNQEDDQVILVNRSGAVAAYEGR